MGYSDNIAEALVEAPEDASDKSLAGLGEALAEFKTKAHRSYDGVRRQPFANKLVGAIEEAIDIRAMRHEEVN
jgi:hypothetical protein